MPHSDAVTVTITYSNGDVYRGYGSNRLTWDTLPGELAWLRINAEGRSITLTVRSGWLYG